MRNVLIFAGSSCPALASQICYKLGTTPAEVELSQFANGETSVKILTSIRDKDVFVVQSGSSKINDSIMELLIMISACKGGSANKVTAVLPYFPYSRQSKKKSHRGAITARMLANLLDIAGVRHVITIDLHASQMQGFFKCPVDNLHAEPLIATWIRHNVPNWREAVCVSKNPGGTKRVTSLADALKLNFGMITTEKKRGGGNMISSITLTRRSSRTSGSCTHGDMGKNGNGSASSSKPQELRSDTSSRHENVPGTNSLRNDTSSDESKKASDINENQAKSIENTPIRESGSPFDRNLSPKGPSNSASSVNQSPQAVHLSVLHANGISSASIQVEDEIEFIDERARDIIQGRLVHGHIVPDDYPTHTPSSFSMSANIARSENNSTEKSQAPYYMPHESDVGDGADDVVVTSDEEEEIFKNPKFEHMITLVGDVRDRTVFIIDDMIDKAGSWIAAAECVIKRGGAEKVYCIATHGLFGGDSLEELQDCDCIDTIVVTNSFPISPHKVRTTKKLVILDLTNLLSEAIRRNHYGESISALFTHSYD